MSWWRRVASTYSRIGRLYWACAPQLLVMALVIFLPLGLLDAVSAQIEAEDFKLDTGFRIAAVAGAIGALTTTSLLGTVFYSGAVSALLARPKGEPVPR